MSKHDSPGDVGEKLGNLLGEKHPVCQPPKKPSKPNPVEDAKPAKPEECPH